MQRILFIFLSTIILLGCNNTNRTDATANEQPVPGLAAVPDEVSRKETFVKHLETAHSFDTWDDKKAVAFNIDLKFNGQQRLKGKITSLTNSAGIRIDKKDGTKIIYDGDGVFLCPKDANEEGARFDIFTWQYFFALPYKLSDEGTKLEMMSTKQIGGENYNRARLFFQENTGDSPDDWYVLYQEPATGLLHAAAYIVNFNSEQEEAEKNPHAIVYRDYVVKRGIPVSTRWTFHNWSEQGGIGEQIGEAAINNVVFFEAGDELFEAPENSKLIER